MKYEQIEPVPKPFIPATITLESQAEVNALASVFRKIGGSGEARNLFIRLSNSISASSNLRDEDLNRAIIGVPNGMDFNQNAGSILGFTK